MKNIDNVISKIKNLKSDLSNKDFLLTWEQTKDELLSVLSVAEALKMFRDNNISPKVFEDRKSVV